MAEYSIVGDTDKYEGNLIFLCGRDKKRAETILENVLKGETHGDKKVIEHYTNIRLKEVEDKDCWWNQGGLD